MIDTIEAARVLGVSAQTLYRWRKDGGGPPWYRVGDRHVRYKPEEVLAWNEARVRRGEPKIAPEAPQPPDPEDSK